MLILLVGLYILGGVLYCSLVGLLPFWPVVVLIGLFGLFWGKEVEGEERESESGALPTTDGGEVRDTLDT